MVAVVWLEGGRPEGDLLDQMARRSLPLEQALSNGRPTVVEFYADWCESCRTMAPGMEQMVEQHPQVDLVLLNVDNPSWQPQVQRWNVKAFPICSSLMPMAKAAVNRLAYANRRSSAPLPLRWKPVSPCPPWRASAPSAAWIPLMNPVGATSVATWARAATAKAQRPAVATAQRANDRRHARQALHALAQQAQRIRRWITTPQARAEQIPEHALQPRLAGLMLRHDHRGSNSGRGRGIGTLVVVGSLRERNQHSRGSANGQLAEAAGTSPEMARSACCSSAGISSLKGRS